MPKVESVGPSNKKEPLLKVQSSRSNELNVQCVCDRLGPVFGHNDSQSVLLQPLKRVQHRQSFVVAQSGKRLVEQEYAWGD